MSKFDELMAMANAAASGGDSSAQKPQYGQDSAKSAQPAQSVTVQPKIAYNPMDDIMHMLEPKAPTQPTKQYVTGNAALDAWRSSVNTLANERKEKEAKAKAEAEQKEYKQLQSQLDRIDANRAYVTTTEQNDALEKERASVVQRMREIDGTKAKPTVGEKVVNAFKGSGSRTTEGFTPEQEEQYTNLLLRLDSVNLSAAFAITTEQSDAIEKERKETLSALHQLDTDAGRAARAYDARDRADAFFKSWGKGTAASYTNTAGSVLDLADAAHQASGETQRRIADNPYAGYATDPLTEANFAAAPTSEETSGFLASQRKERDALYETADKLLTESEQQMAKAKQGTSAAGSFALDAAKTGMDIAADTAASAVGVPGLANMAVRVYGGESQQARLAGDDVYTAAAKGLKSALIEVATEKVAGPFEKAYGKTALSSSINKAVDKLNASGLLKWAADAAGEGFEEGMSDVLNTVADHIFGWDDGISTVWNDIKGDKEQILYDMLLGAFVGAFGGAGNLMNTNAQSNAAPVQQDTQTEAQGAEAVQQPQMRANVQEGNLAPASPANVKQGGSDALNSALYLNSRDATAKAQENTAPMQEMESTAVNDDPAKHTPEEQARIEEYKAATDENLVNYIETVRDNPGAKIGRYSLKPVSDKAAADIKAITGVDVSGNKTVIEPRIIEHILKRHGKDGAANNSMRDVNDIARIQYVIDNYDNVEDGGRSSAYQTVKPNGKPGQAQTVKFSKAINGTYYVIEAVPDTKAKTVFVTSAYLSNKKAGDMQTANAEATRVTSETKNAQSPVYETSSRPGSPQTSGVTGDVSDTSIPTTGRNVNSENGGNAVRERGFSKNVRTDSAMDAKLRETFDASPEMYAQLANKDTLAKAREIFSKGLNEARSEVEQALGAAKNGSKLAPEMVPLARMVANELSRGGDVESARRITADVATELTAAGQLNQAARLLRDADPNTALAAIQKSIDAINAEFAKQHKRSNWKAELTKAETEKILSTDFTEDGAYERVYDEIATRLGKEMPSSVLEKLTEIRRINMLLRPRTQIKNVASNVPMIGLRKGAETLSIGIQSALTKTGLMDEAKRTRAWASREQRQLAKDYYEANKADINGQSNKWDFKSALREKRTIFKGGAIEKAVSKMTGKEIDSFGEALRQVTYSCLEAGDAPFVKSAFVDSLAQYCAAKGITDSKNITQEAIDFATVNAMEATFKNANFIADVVNQVKRNSSPALSAAVDILIPFTTTPANILSLMGDYSPIGFGKMFAKDGVAAKVDAFSKASVGTAVMALGLALRSAGIITGGEDDDKDKAALDKATGQGTYSIGGKVSYDWAQPAGSLLAFGAEIADAIKGQESWLSAFMNAIYTAGDATLNLSLFQNVVSVLRGSGKPTQQIVDAIMEGGATQLVPGLAGDIAKIIDGTVRSTYTGGNVFADIGAKVLSNTPILSQKLPESVNVKGEANTRGGFAERAVNILLNPTNTTSGKRNAVDEEIYRLYDATGSTVFFPSVSPYKIEYANQTYTMDGKDRETFQKVQGRTYYELAQPLLSSEMYKALSDDQKASVLKSIRDYALDAAKRQFVDGRGGEYSNDQWDPVAELTKGQISAYIPAKQALKDGANGNGGRKTFEAIDLLLDGYKKLPGAVQDKLNGDTLNVEKLLYADSKGIGSKAWYDTHNAIDGTSAVAAASSVSRNFKGSDEEKLNALRTMNSYTMPDKETGKQSAIVRRYEAAMNYGVSFDDWTKLEETIVNMFGSGTPNKSEIYAAAKEALPDIPRYKVYSLYKKDSANENKVDFYDEYFASLYEPTGGKVDKDFQSMSYEEIMDVLRVPGAKVVKAAK